MFMAMRSGHIDDFAPTYIPEFDTPEKFVDEKIEMLQGQCYIKLSEKDIAHLRTLKTEHAINAAVRSLINKYWG